MGYESEKYYRRMNREIEQREHEWLFRFIAEGILAFKNRNKNVERQTEQVNNYQGQTGNNQQINCQENYPKFMTPDGQINRQYMEPPRYENKPHRYSDNDFTPISPKSKVCKRCNKTIRPDVIKCPYCNKVQDTGLFVCKECYYTCKIELVKGNKCPRCRTKNI